MVRRGVGGFVLFGLVASCGARTPLIVDESCHGPAMKVTSDLPTLYYVLDHSRSMREGDKWGQVRTALATVMAEVGPRARFATVIFPAPGGGSCAAGKELMPPEQGSGARTIQEFLTITAPEPEGGTPTAETLRVLAKELVGAKDTFVVLATDGGPNCNSALGCDVGTCVLNIEGLGGCSLTGPNCCTGASALNCLDDARAVSAVEELKAAGVLTYIVGIPGSDVYGPVLESMATAGGTARPTSPGYYRVDSAQALAGSLEDIANRVVKRCTLHLERAPAHPESMRLLVRGIERSRDTDYTVSGATLTLLGGACSDYDGDLMQLHVEDGCIPAPIP